MRAGEVTSQLSRPAARGLSRPARAMFKELLICARSGTGLPRWPIRDLWLQQRTGYSESSVYRARKELAGLGLIVVERTGEGRDMSSYRVILTPVGVEVEAYQARAQEMARAMTAGGDLNPDLEDVEGAAAGTLAAVEMKALGRQGEGSEPSPPTPPTHARPGSSGVLPPLPVPGQGPESNPDAAPLRGTEELSPGSFVAGATTCPKAASRGRPCSSCRACGTNPRALRKRAATERATQRVPDILATGTPPDRRAAVNERGAAAARAAWAARMASQAAVTPESQRGADPPSGAGGAP